MVAQKLRFEGGGGRGGQSREVGEGVGDSKEEV